MDKKHNKQLVPLAKILRTNMTKEERRLWYEFLRAYPVKFLRQKVIGKYIVDFYCAKARLAVEIDGSQHYEDVSLQADAIRTAYLEQYDIKVLRFNNLEVIKNFEEVCAVIDESVRRRLET